MSGKYSDELLKALGYCGYEDLSPKGLTLADIQVEHLRWAQKNFGDQRINDYTKILETLYT